MLAREIAEDYPVVDVDADAMDAARIMAQRRLPGIVVTDGDPDTPIAVLPGSQVIRMIIPGYVQDDPSLARVFDEKHAQELCNRLRGKRVRDMLPDHAPELPVVQGDDQVMEIAALMAQLRSPLVAVIDEGHLVGVVTISHLLELLLADA